MNDRLAPRSQRKRKTPERGKRPSSRGKKRNPSQYGYSNGSGHLSPKAERNKGRTSSEKKMHSSSSRSRRNRRKKKEAYLRWIFFLALLVLLILLLMIVIKGCSKKFKESIDPTVWSEEVVAYRPKIEEKAKQYGIEDYTDILLSIMMQESKGLGTDPMQSSECIHNTEYERVPDGIKDSDYSIDCGVQYFADALDEANCEGLHDTNALMLAIQGYNYGHGYISWAIDNYGGYSKENAEIFSNLLKEELDWSAYGDPDYVVKVLNYYYASSEV